MNSMTREEAIKYWDFLEGKEIEAIHTLIPESEDERIINAIISYLRMTSLYSSNGCKKPEMIDWLEKQKEQHHSSRFLPNDWVVYDGPLGHAILQIKDVIDGRYTFVDNDSTLLVEDSDKFLRPLTPKDMEKKEEWKPSEEQMSMLLAVINDPNNAGAESCYMALKSIYNNLKKL